MLNELFVSMSDGKLMLIVKCGGIGIVSLGVFLLMCILLRLEIVTDALKRLKK